MTDDARLRARYRKILRFAARHLVSTWWFELFLPRIGLTVITERTRTRRLQKIARRFHSIAVDLGGLMIKVGQFLSTRLDVLPPEFTRELEGLQDEVPAVPFAEIRALAEVELGVSLERAFSFVDEVAVAAASLGQVHRARLAEVDAAETGLSDIVIKIQRPGIGDIVDVDLRALRRIAGWLSHVRLVYERVDMPALMEEFAITSLEEIDYLHEASNAERFRENFADDPRVATPDIVWERTTRRVLTLEDVSAIKVNDISALTAAGINPVDVAAEFAAVMFDQLFVHGYFHADPHPGNIFVTPTPGGEREWRFTFIDFGMMGEVPAGLKQGLRQLLIAAASRDGNGMVDAIRDVGVLLPSADTAELERAMTKLFSRFGGLGFAELQQIDPREFRAFANEFQDVVRSLPFQLPENFLLIGRAMSLTSGMCSSINPAFNIWDAVEPYSASLIRTEGSNLVKDVAREAVSIAAVVARLPRRIDKLTTRIEEGRLAVQSPRIERRLASIERTGRRIISAILFAALLLGGIMLRPTDAAASTWLLVLSGIPLLHALLAGVVSRRGPL